MVSKKILFTSNRSIVIISLILIIAFHLLHNCLWWQNDNVPRGGDAPNHVLFQRQFFQAVTSVLDNQSLTLFSKMSLIAKIFNGKTYSEVPYYIYWPRFISLTSSFFTCAIDDTFSVLRLSIFPYFILLIVATYLFGKALQSVWMGLSSAALVSLYPIMFESSRQYGLDLPLTAFFMLTLYLLLKSRGFKHRFYSVAFGIAAGTGALIKGQIGPFIIFPFIYMLGILTKKIAYASRRHKGFSGIRRLTNLSLMLYFACLAGSLWWGNKIREAARVLPQHFINDKKVAMESFCSAPKFSWGYLTWDFLQIFHKAVCPYLTACFLVALCYFLVRKGMRNKAFVIASFVGPFLLFSIFCAAKDERFLMPVLPLMAVVTMSSCHAVNSRRTRYLLLFLVFAVAIFQFYVISFYDGCITCCNVNKKVFGITQYGGSPLMKPRGYDKEIADLIDKGSDEGEDLKIGYISLVKEEVGPCYHVLYYNLLPMHLKIRLIPLRWEADIFLTCINDFDFILFFDEREHYEWPDKHFREDFIVAANEARYIANFSSDEAVDKLISGKEKFDLIKMLKYPDLRYYCFVYKNKDR